MIYVSSGNKTEGVVFYMWRKPLRPKFICIGFQKCGTTTLYELLRQHKDIILPMDVKEPMFYRCSWWREKKGKDWYEERYFGCYDEHDPRMPGEVNAGLGENPCVKGISEDFPKETRLIFMMRNPAERTYSSYKYFLARGFLPMRYVVKDKKIGHAASFDAYVKEILGDEKKRNQIMQHRLRYLVFAGGMYATVIHEYEKHFPKEQMHFILFEDFVQDEKGECRKLYDFLGLPDDPDIVYGIKSNEGNQRSSGPIWSKWNIAFTSFNYWLSEYLYVQKNHPVAFRRYHVVHDWVIDHSFQKDEDHAPMLDETRKILQDYYQNEVREVEEILGRSLQGIWY